MSMHDIAGDLHYSTAKVCVPRQNFILHVPKLVMKNNSQKKTVNRFALADMLTNL